MILVSFVVALQNDWGLLGILTCSVLPYWNLCCLFMQCLDREKLPGGLNQNCDVNHMYTVHS